MPRSEAIFTCVSFLSISIFLASAIVVSVFIVWIVQKSFTFVKKKMKLKKDKEIKDMFSRQIKKFLAEYVDGYYEKGKYKSTKIAEDMMKFYPGEEINKNNVKQWLVSPTPGFIYWLERECGMNIDWLTHGEEDPSIKPVKIMKFN